MKGKFERLRLKDFLYLFSLQVGVVYVCCFGLVLAVLAFLKLCCNPLVEEDPGVAAGSYVIASVFILASLLVYTIGLAGSALAVNELMSEFRGLGELSVIQGEDSRLLKIAGGILIFVAVYWCILTALSFTGDCYIVRYVCVDNRCTERLYLQNGYWRPPIVLCGRNESFLNQRDSGARITSANLTATHQPNSNITDYNSPSEPNVVINITIGKDEQEDDLEPDKFREEASENEPPLLPGQNPEANPTGAELDERDPRRKGPSREKKEARLVRNKNNPANKKNLVFDFGYFETGAKPEQDKENRNAVLPFVIEGGDPEKYEHYGSNYDAAVTNLTSSDGSRKGSFGEKLRIRKKKLTDTEDPKYSKGRAHRGDSDEKNQETDEDEFLYGKSLKELKKIPEFLNRNLLEGKNQGKRIEPNNKPTDLKPETDEDEFLNRKLLEGKKQGKRIAPNNKPTDVKPETDEDEFLNRKLLEGKKQGKRIAPNNKPTDLKPETGEDEFLNGKLLEGKDKGKMIAPNNKPNKKHDTDEDDLKLHDGLKKGKTIEAKNKSNKKHQTDGDEFLDQELQEGKDKRKKIGPQNKTKTNTELVEADEDEFTPAEEPEDGGDHGTKFPLNRPRLRQNGIIAQPATRPPTNTTQPGSSQHHREDAVGVTKPVTPPPVEPTQPAMKLSNMTTEYVPERESSNMTTEYVPERESPFKPIWTPIGPTYSYGHFVLSVIYAVLILPFWYLYPIWLMFSFATQIDLGEDF